MKGGGRGDIFRHDRKRWRQRGDRQGRRMNSGSDGLGRSRILHGAGIESGGAIRSIASASGAFTSDGKTSGVALPRRPSER